MVGRLSGSKHTPPWSSLLETAPTNVSFPFLDFSTCERRGDFCRREVEFNQAAPHIYIEALPITHSASGLAINGNGEVVDWIVAMKRFEQDDLLDQIAMNGDLPNELLAEIADKIARFHDACEMTPEHGGYDAMQWIFDDNITEMRAYPDILDPVLADNARGKSWRQCLIGAVKPVSFGIVTAIFIYKTSFWTTDSRHSSIASSSTTRLPVSTSCTISLFCSALAHRDRPDAANFVLNRYLARTGDFDGAALLPLFLSCRAAISAKVSAIASKEHPERIDETARYLSQAVSFLETDPPRLIAVGGTPELRHWPIPSPLRSERSLAPFWSACRPKTIARRRNPRSLTGERLRPPDNSTNLRPRHQDIGALIVGWHFGHRGRHIHEQSFPQCLEELRHAPRCPL